MGNIFRDGVNLGIVSTLRLSQLVQIQNMVVQELARAHPDYVTASRQKADGTIIVGVLDYGRRIKAQRAHLDLRISGGEIRLLRTDVNNAYLSLSVRLGVNGLVEFHKSLSLGIVRKFSNEEV